MRSNWPVSRLRRKALITLGALASWGGGCFPSVIAASLQADPRQCAERLIAAYPEHLLRVEGNDLVWRDGTRMPISDGRQNKSFAELLEQPDIKDMCAYPYEPGPPKRRPAVNEDPGRIRYEPFFTKMYGDCQKGEVQARLREVLWMPSHGRQTVKITTVNGVADKLEAVVKDLERLPAMFVPYLVPSAGTLNCRTIAGSHQRSVHGYGAAIDISVSFADYWRWPKVQPDPLPYRNRIPFEIVAIFEAHGFIWGGKWYHFDTMHFEYRPELIPLKRARPPE